MLSQMDHRTSAKQRQRVPHFVYKKFYLRFRIFQGKIVDIILSLPDQHGMCGVVNTRDNAPKRMKGGRLNFLTEEVR